ncbi:MAG: sugar-binding protein, partial [Candidatus Zixiibacteriota bacterium]
DIFVKYGVDAVFTGHYHEYFSGEYDGIKYTGIGSSGGGPGITPDGLKYHFLWVTADDQDVNIAVIKKDGVLPWDNNTAAERLVYRPLKQTGLAFINQALVAEDMTIPDCKIGLKINNSASPGSINDTLKWNIPEGWKVDPAVMPISVEPKTIDTVYFTVAGDGSLFPAPSVAANLNYTESKKVPVEKALGPARIAVCNPVEKKIKIDGTLSEKCWQNAETKFFGPEGSKTAAEPVDFYFAYDKNNLYLAAKCSESMIDSISAKTAAHDGAVHRDDCVGYFIAPDYALDTFYQIYFNPAGFAYDVKYWLDEDGYLDGSLAWNGQYEVKSAKNDGSWTIEIKMPLKQFGVQMEQGKKMHLNFRRKQPRLGNADWITPIEYDPYYYGQLIMR